MKIQDIKSSLKRFLVTGALVASMPIVMGNGGCATFENSMNDLSTVAFGMNSEIYRRDAQLQARRGNFKESEKSSARAAGYNALYNFGSTGSQRQYQSSEAEKDRQNNLEAAQIRADAERDAANIKANAEIEQKAVSLSDTQSNRYGLRERVIDGKSYLEAPYRADNGEIKYKIIGAEASPETIEQAKQKMQGFIPIKQEFQLHVGKIVLNDKQLQITKKISFEADDKIDCFIPYRDEMSGKLVTISVYNESTNVLYTKSLLINPKEGIGRVIGWDGKNLRKGLYCIKAEVDGDKIGIYERKNWFEIKNK